MGNREDQRTGESFCLTFEEGELELKCPARKGTSMQPLKSPESPYSIDIDDLSGTVVIFRDREVGEDAIMTWNLKDIATSDQEDHCCKMIEIALKDPVAMDLITGAWMVSRN